jgi:hypothetical protein
MRRRDFIASSPSSSAAFGCAVASESLDWISRALQAMGKIAKQIDPKRGDRSAGQAAARALEVQSPFRAL